MNTVAKVKQNNLKELKIAEVRLEHEVSSIDDRVRDIRWRIEGGDDFEVSKLMDELQRAQDKLRETKRELLAVREDIIRQGA